jgi:hypothetical protein
MTVDADRGGVRGQCSFCDACLPDGRFLFSNAKRSAFICDECILTALNIVFAAADSADVAKSTVASSRWRSIARSALMWKTKGAN